MVHYQAAPFSNGTGGNMMQYYQETDYKEVIDLPDRLNFPRIEAMDETTGSNLFKHFYPIPEDNSLIKSAWDITYKANNEQVVKEARRFLSVLQEMTAIFPHLGLDLDSVPPLYAFNVDDNSFLIEWIFNDFRIGFSVEQNINDSSWYLVSNKKYGVINASGYLSIKDSRSLILWLLTFVILILLRPSELPH
jgi:hypothetical protein